jgi:ornithine cyclodeaminase/alanine dehydrogenase-like protein (mu-crystallin family)
MMLDARSVTALRTGAVAAVAARTLAPPGAATVGLIGCGPHGAWTARAMASAGYGPGVCHDPNAGVAAALADELGWRTGPRAEAVACDIVCCVTPGAEIVVDAGDLRPGLHLNMLGADAAGKAEASLGAVSSCQLFCDEWDQASHGGELAGAVAAGLVTRDAVTELGAVLAGEAPGRAGPEAVTLFDSTGSRSRTSRSREWRWKPGAPGASRPRPCASKAGCCRACASGPACAWSAASRAR